MPLDPCPARAAQQLARAVLARLRALAVVIPDPSLAPGRCGLPRPLARRLFAPRLAAGMPLDAVAGAPVLVGRRRPRALDHMASFACELVDGEALRLSPQDMQSIHIRAGSVARISAFLTREAEEDARLMALDALPGDDGRVRCSLSPDARLGLAYLTSFEAGGRGGAVAPADPALAWPEGIGAAGPLRLPEDWGRAGGEAIRRLRGWQLARLGRCVGFFASVDEARFAVEAGELAVGALIFARETGTYVATTAGRWMAAQALGLEVAGASALTRLDSRRLDALARRLDARGMDVRAALGRLEALGLDWATRSGLSLGIDALRVAPQKEALMTELWAKLRRCQEEYDDGLLMESELEFKQIDCWSWLREAVAHADARALDADPKSARWTLREAGLWGARHEVIHAARGVLCEPSSGAYLSRGVARSLSEGLRPHDVFLCCIEARGVRLQRYGLRPRRAFLWGTLVEALGSTRVVAEDCGALGSLELAELPSYDPDFPVVSLVDRVAGRFSVDAGAIVTEDDARRHRARWTHAVRVRTLVTCEAEGGVCAVCHGAGPGLRGLPEVGDAVGMWAAQAIASRAHLLLERTMFLGHWSHREVVARASGRASLLSSRREPCFETPDGLVTAAHDVEVVVRDDEGAEIQREYAPYGAKLSFSPGQRVEQGTTLAAWSAPSVLLRSAAAGTARLVNLRPREYVPEHRPGAASDRQPRVEVVDASGQVCFVASPGGWFSVLVEDGQTIAVGDALVEASRSAQDIEFRVGSLSLLGLLAASPGPSALARLDGVASIERGAGGERVTITPRSAEGLPLASWSVVHPVPAGRHVVVADGQLCRAGDVLWSAETGVAGVCEVFGREEAGRWLVDRLLLIFGFGGLPLDARHAELVAREMLDFVRVTGAGGGQWAPGELVRRGAFFAANEALEARGEAPAQAEPAVVGLGRVAARRSAVRGAAAGRRSRG